MQITPPYVVLENVAFFHKIQDFDPPQKKGKKKTFRLNFWSKKLIHRGRPKEWAEKVIIVKIIPFHPNSFV